MSWCLIVLVHGASYSKVWGWVRVRFEAYANFACAATHDVHESDFGPTY
jgi:hypothetical protein